jgi:hypothetical protein
VLWTQFRAALAENQLHACIQLLRQLDDNPSNLKRHLRWDALQTLLQLCAQHGTVEEVRASLRLYFAPAIPFASSSPPQPRTRRPLSLPAAAIRQLSLTVSA